MADTIDLTPEGLKTPEGAARVKKAMEQVDRTTVVCADNLKELLEQFNLNVINGNIQIRNRDSEDMQMFREVFMDAERANAVRKAAQNEFLKAVAGVL